MNVESMEVDSASNSVANTETDSSNQSNLTDANPKQSTAQQGQTSGSSGETTQTPVLTNLQRIKQQKQDIYNWQKNKKLLKLAMYSPCQVIVPI